MLIPYGHSSLRWIHLISFLLDGMTVRIDNGQVTVTKTCNGWAAAPSHLVKKVHDRLISAAEGKCGDRVEKCGDRGRLSFIRKSFRNVHSFAESRGLDQPRVRFMH
jgi:hypothetical protein